MKTLFLFTFLGILPLSAQWRHFGDPRTTPEGFFGVGFSTPVNPVATRLDAGWNIAGGIGVSHGYGGIMLDAMFTDFGVNHSTLLQAGARSGKQKYWAVTLDPIFHVNKRGPVDFYITGGGGIYGQITNYRAASDFVVGRNAGRYDLTISNTIYKPGVNAGAGFSFSLPELSNVKIFAEARYHHVFTNYLFNRGSGVSFIPVTVGVRI
jgi:hypothetical protein